MPRCDTLHRPGPGTGCRAPTGAADRRDALITEASSPPKQLVPRPAGRHCPSRRCIDTTRPNTPAPAPKDTLWKTSGWDGLKPLTRGSRLRVVADRRAHPEHLAGGDEVSRPGSQRRLHPGLNQSAAVGLCGHRALPSPRGRTSLGDGCLRHRHRALRAGPVLPRSWDNGRSVSHRLSDSLGP